MDVKETENKKPEEKKNEDEITNDEIIEKVEKLISRDYTLNPIDQHLIEKFWTELQTTQQVYMKVEEEYKRMTAQYQNLGSKILVLQKMLGDEILTIQKREGLSVDTKTLDMNKKPWRLFKQEIKSDANA